MVEVPAKDSENRVKEHPADAVRGNNYGTQVQTKEELPAEHPPLFAERDGAWLIDLDGAVEKTELVELSTTNVSLLNERLRCVFLLWTKT